MTLRIFRQIQWLPAFRAEDRPEGDTRRYPRRWVLKDVKNYRHGKNDQAHRNPRVPQELCAILAEHLNGRPASGG